MVTFAQCVSFLKAGKQRFNVPNVDLVRTSLEADSIASGNIFRIPIESGLGNVFKKFSNDGKLVAGVETNTIGKVSNLTLYEYAQNANLMRRTHSFGTPDTTYRDVMQVAENGEILSNIGVNRSPEYVQKIMDKYFGISEPYMIKTSEHYWLTPDGLKNGHATYNYNSCAIPEQTKVINNILETFGFARGS